MTKGELVRLLEPFDDDVLILVDLTREFASVATTRPIDQIFHVLKSLTSNDEILLVAGQ